MQADYVTVDYVTAIKAVSRFCMSLNTAEYVNYTVSQKASPTFSTVT